MSEFWQGIVVGVVVAVPLTACVIAAWRWRRRAAAALPAATADRRMVRARARSERLVRERLGVVP